ncbi:MAG TPA: LytR C-terminal domain-containing protein [Actinomycetes bacterium]|nr:LytR C-terminal domain-containing protein [Actinomycetes bacterium]
MRPGPTARAALVLASFLVLFVLVDRISSPGRADRGTAGATGPRVTTTTRAQTSTAATTATTAPSTTAAPTTATTTAPTGSTLRPAEGVTVQVLNGAYVAGLANRVAGRVRQAGYDVVAANTALVTPVSRVYYTAGHRADAEAFRQRFPGFQEIDPAPPSLSREVALHAVIGRNYPGI